MDNQMGWESSLWSNQHNGIEESFELANPIQEPYQMVNLHHQIGNSDWEDQLCVINGLDEDLGIANPSLECLLSATNSNTDTASVEDDGISMVFSAGYTNLWNFDTISNKSNVVTNKEAQCEPDNHTNVIASTKPESLKRNSAQEDQEGGFHLISSKRPRTSSDGNKYSCPGSSSNISFQQPSSSSACSSVLIDQEPDPEAIAHMKEMIYRAAAFRPVNLGAEVVERPRRKNVKISSDPQTVAARQRRERISERIKVLQKLVPGGTKMDTASMLDEAASYLKFLRSQVKALENLGHKINHHHDPSSNLMRNHCFSSSSLPSINNLSFPMQAFAPLAPNPSHLHHHVQDQVGFSKTITKC